MEKFVSPQSDNSIFDEALTPKKPWYKRWWLWAYVIIFISSLFILTLFADTTEQLVGSLSNSSQELQSGEVGDDGLSLLPANQRNTEGVSAETARLRLAQINAPSKGPADAPVTIVEFGDFQCPFCRQSYPVIKQLLAQYPQDIRFVYVDFPITSIHPDSFDAALAAQCAREQQTFWQYHDLLFQNQSKIGDAGYYEVLARTTGLDTDAFATCMRSERYQDRIENNFKLGVELGVLGTPTFFVQGHRLPGDLPLETWQQIIQVALLSAEQENNN